MDQHTYEGLVERLEAEAQHSPAAFRGKVLLLSAAAYIVLFAVLAGIATLIYFGFAWAQEKHRTADLIRIGLFALLMAPLFFGVLRMFFLRLEPPGGRPISREEAPKLYEVLDKMRRKLKGPPIHHVLIDDEYNAAIAQIPRWGLFGGHTNYLMLGLPYMLGVPPKEMLATVAHEYGHLCGNHGKTGAWVYRQRRTFGALYDQLESNAGSSWIHSLMMKALETFMPYYNAYTFVLSRQNEYEADLTATELVGADANANGLIRDALLGHWIRERFWPKLFQHANDGPRPPFMPFSAMRTAFHASYGQWATQDRLRTAWAVDSDVLDTHPALRERVEAIGKPAALPAPAERTAADALLGESVKQLTAEFDQLWWENEKPEWETRYKYVTRSKARLKELERQPFTELPLHELQELALLRADFESPQTAKPVLEHLMRQPGGPFPKPSYIYGRILLDEGDDRGLEHLLSAARADQSLLRDAAEAGYFYLRKKCGEQAAQAWWERLFPSQ
jgi:Zn-dependent protease with chaperone function